MCIRDRVEIAPVMEALEKSGRHGKKNGRGFYHYSEDGKRLGVDEKIYGELGLSAPRDPYTREECVERGIFAMINECSRALLDDRIVETPHEVDLAMIMGTGFPPFRGGLLRYADSLGVKQIVEKLERYSRDRNAKRLTPAPALRGCGAFYSS
ncbi:MAG: fatty oxidation complex subunit alpha, partial [Bdellovibrionaceae bacterium]|nr:fatty oxidation complex subunit alpha [Pseudobdellovibrionaceae bacterium]